MKNTTTLSVLEEDILTLLGERELYGLQIIAAVDEASGGKRKIGAGSLYPTLHRMEEKRLILSEWSHEASGGGRRKYYGATDMGIKRLWETQDYRAKLAKYCPVE